MHKRKRCLLVSSILFSATVSAATTPAEYHWQGFYVGGLAGAVFSRFNLQTSTQPASLLNVSQANAVNTVGKQSIDPSGFLGGIEGGYNWQLNPHLLIGIETDIQALSTNGETNTGAVMYPGSPTTQFVLTSYANNNWMWTARPRIGLIENNWLFYLTGGPALALLQTDFLFSTNVGQFESQRVSKVTPGYVVGAGVEAGLTNHISMKAEYLFADFNNQTGSMRNHSVPADQNFTNTVKLKTNMLRLGVNYEFDDKGAGLLNGLQLIPGLFSASQWQTDTGARLFLSTGVNGAPQPLLDDGVLVSRLTFNNLKAIAGETYARADHNSGFFVKGYLGAGSVINGELTDEDFPVDGAYSNTYSNVLGNLSYATIDVGYSFLNTPTAKTGVFVGYNYYAQNLNVYNCTQMAGSAVCVGDGSLLNNFMVLSEDDKYNSLRVGLSTQFDVTNQLTLTSEAAYLPAISFTGTDMHNARQLIGPEQAGYGDGAMLESMLDYQFSRSWDVGLGGRYWMWNMHSGSVDFIFLGESGTSSQPARFNAERYGLFLQLNYRDQNEDHYLLLTSPMHWKGVFVGGDLGGAWGRGYWSDPFGATPGAPGFTNVPGFGDQIRSTGPLGGVDLNINWQTQQWVYGVDGSLNLADIRGENTVFSGLSGLNGKTTINYFATLAAKLGVAHDRSLFYLNGGGAAINTNYTLNGNNTAVQFGEESRSMTNWGWLAGMGVEYALTDRWTSDAEYDYIHVPNHSISFPAVATINTQSLSANQTLNVFKVGVNYKLDGLN